jgi:hypothetical protein
MAKENKQANKKDGVQVVLAGVFILFAFLLIAKSHNTEVSQLAGERTFTSYSSVKNESLNLSSENLAAIERELKEVDRKERQMRAKVLIENRARTEGLEFDQGVYEESAPHAINLQPSREREDIVNESRDRELRHDYRALTPAERISEKIARDEWAIEYDQEYQEYYTKAFIENARRDGLDIRLNKNLDVVDLSPTNQDKPLRFPQSATSGIPRSAK